MSLDMAAFLCDVKRAAVEAVLASKPFAFTMGRVSGVEPLRIQIDQKLELTGAQLILTSLVSDYTVMMTVDHTTEKALGADDEHAHNYVGTKKFRVHLGLHVGEKVVLLRTDGGQKYIVLDRVTGDSQNGA